jgi:hypothetical protein
MIIYELLNQESKRITLSDFEIVNKVITNSFPKSLEFKNGSENFINIRYNLNGLRVNLMYGESNSEMWVLSNIQEFEEIKKNFEKKTKLGLELMASK